MVQLKKGLLREHSIKTGFSFITGESEFITPDDRLLLENIIIQLKETEISEISSILRILRNDVFKQNERLERWKESVEVAAFSTDKNLYDRLLNCN